MKPHPWKDGEFSPEMSDLIGRTFTDVFTTEDEGDELHLTCSDGTFVFYHEQGCCESVDIEDVVGDLADLVGTPMLRAEESTSCDTPHGVRHEYEPESQTWTFYRFATIKGYVDVRWFGESNGYYSESVDLKFIPAPSTDGANHD